MKKSENELNHVQSPRSVTGTLVASRISLRAPYNHNRLPLPKEPTRELVSNSIDYFFHEFEYDHTI